MPIDIPEILSEYSGFFGKGFVLEFGSEIVKGMLVELLRIKKVDVSKATKWVQDNSSLWDGLEPKFQNNLKKLAKKVGNLDWIDTDWAIGAMREEFPAVASLFLGWKKANNWLGRQLEILKREVSE